MSQQYSIDQVTANLDKIFQEVEQGESVQITSYFELRVQIQNGLFD